jgi:hypothetical protein
MTTHKSRHAVIAASALALCLITGTTPARVSFSWGTASQSNKALTSLGGTSVYKSSLNLNGADAALSVFSFNSFADDLVREFTTIYPTALFSFNGGSMAFGLVQDDKTVLRLILLQLSSESQTLVVKIEQSEDAYKKSVKPPQTHMIREMPEFPGSTPTFYARNKDTDIQLASSSTRASKQEVEAFYESRLAAKGWRKPLQQTSSLNLFIKGSTVCMLMASEPDRTGTSNITLLHKTHGVK